MIGIREFREFGKWWKITSGTAVKFYHFTWVAAKLCSSRVTILTSEVIIFASGVTIPARRNIGTLPMMVEMMKGYM